MFAKYIKRGNWASWLICIILLLSICLLAGCPKTEMNTLVKLTPSKPVVKIGESFDLNIEIQPSQSDNVAGVQFDLSFNPAVLKIDSVQEGDIFKQGGTQSYFMPGTVDNVSGTLKDVAGCTIGAGHTVTNPGIFAVIKCTALKDGESVLSLSNITVANMEALVLPFDLDVTQLNVTVPEDLNQDGKVDLADLLLVVAAFGTAGLPGWRKEDINNDGRVDVLDMVVIAQDFD